MNMNVSILDKLIQVAGAQAALACIPHRSTAVVVRITRPSGVVLHSILPEPKVWLGKSCPLVHTVHGWVTAAAVEPLSDPGQELEIVPTRQYLRAGHPYNTDGKSVTDSIDWAQTLMERTQRLANEKKRFKEFMRKPKKGSYTPRQQDPERGLRAIYWKIVQLTGHLAYEHAEFYRKTAQEFLKDKDLKTMKQFLAVTREEVPPRDWPWLMEEGSFVKPDPADFEPFDAEAEMAALREEARYQWGA